ncbi:MAG: proteasome subunit alpha [Acidimicrobiia bacterium]|nr:proteasome subunit alpha [Acidimicrobiia bacterium]
MGGGYVSPEQYVKDKAEFARKGIARGKSIVAVAYGDGILLLAENPSSTLHKVSEVYDRIAFAGVGRYNEFEALRVAGIRHSDVKGYAYARVDVTAKGLANMYSQTLGHIFGSPAEKPFEVEVMVAEVGHVPEENQIFKIAYDGTLYAESRLAAIGGEEDALAEALERSFEPGAPLSEALGWAKGAFESVAGRTFQVEEWEGAVVDRTLGRRTFRRLSPDEVGGGS